MAQKLPNSYNTLFISELALKEMSIINENVDMKMLTPTIRLVQDIYLTRLLGSSLMVDLQEKIVSSTLTSDDKFLLDAYIQPLMVWGVMKEAPVSISFKFMNKGVSRQNSDNSQPSSLREIEMLMDRASDRFDWYSQRMIDYLCANSEKYPAYKDNQDSDDVKPTSRGYRSRLFLGDDEGCCGGYKYD